MEYKDYIKYHKTFNHAQKLNNPYYYTTYTTSHVNDQNLVKTAWFELSEEKFQITTPINDWVVTRNPEGLNFTIPDTITVKVDGREVTVNGHPIHKELIINPQTGKTIYSLHPARPMDEEEQKKATSILRKHITKYKKRARPIYRLLEGSLTDKKNNENYTSWGNRKNDSMKTHDLYEILRIGKPTQEEIKLLITSGNSSNRYGWVENTDFESSISRVIQRRRGDLKAYALLEGNNEYKTPNELNNL